MGGTSGPTNVDDVSEPSGDDTEPDAAGGVDVVETTEDDVTDDATDTDVTGTDTDADADRAVDTDGAEGVEDGDQVETTSDGDSDGTAAEAPATATASRPGASRLEALLERPWVLLPLYAILAMVVTWPLAAHLADALTFGTEPVRTVPLFNLWTMEWNQEQVANLYGDYWNAPLFHPTPGGFALSEPQPVTGLVFAPIAWFTGNPVLAYNLVALAILMVNGYAGSRLARALGASAGPAALAGALAVGLSFIAHQMGVLQLTAVFPLLLLLEAIVRWAPSGGFWPSVRIGLWLAIAFLTCGYYGLFAMVGIAPVTLVLVRRSWLSRARLTDVAVAAAAFAVLALPILVGQANITSDYERSEDTIRSLSAGGGDFWQLADEAHGAPLVPWLHEMDSGHGLYPGTGLLLLAAAGLLVGSRDPGSARSRGSTLLDERRRPMFLFVGVCLAWVLSRGLKLSVFGFHPYEVVRATVPGFDELRSPFRFAVVAELFLVGLAAYGLDALWHWRWRRLPDGRLRTLVGPSLACVVVALSVLEVGTMPVRLFDVEPHPSAAWVDWLEDQDRQAWASNEGPDDRPVLAFLPFPPNGRVGSFEPTVRGLREALEAGATTVNGYSGLFPEEYHRLAEDAENYPNEEADAVMREYGVDYLVVSRLWSTFDSSRVAWLARYPEVFSDDDVVVHQFG